MDDSAHVRRHAAAEHRAQLVQVRQRRHALTPRRQPRAARRQLLRARRPGHARHLPRVEVALSLAVRPQPRRVDVHCVQPRDRTHRVAEARPALRRRQLVERQVLVHGTLAEVHHVEGSADDGRVLHQRHDARHRHARVGAAQRAQHERLALDGVRCGEQRARGLLAQHELARLLVRARAGEEQERGVALADLELSQLEGRGELVRVVRHQVRRERRDIESELHPVCTIEKYGFGVGSVAAESRAQCKARSTRPRIRLNLRIKSDQWQLSGRVKFSRLASLNRASSPKRRVPFMELQLDNQDEVGESADTAPRAGWSSAWRSVARISRTAGTFPSGQRPYHARLGPLPTTCIGGGGGQCLSKGANQQIPTTEATTCREAAARHQLKGNFNQRLYNYTHTSVDSFRLE